MLEKIAELHFAIIPAGVFLAAMIIGFAVSKLVFARFDRVVARLSGAYGEIVTRALKDIPVFVGAISGVYAVIHFVRLDEYWLRVMEGILLTAVLFCGTVIIARVLSSAVVLYTRTAEEVLPSTSILVNVVQIVVYMLGGLIILQSHGVSITPILTALGVGGLAIALALQETLANLFSGIYILLSRQFRVGDYIKLSTGEEGVVMDITWRSTVIKALANNVIVLPNQKIASATITNYFLPDKEMSILVPVGVGYDSDLEHVETVTVEVAKEVLRDIAGGVDNYEPVVRYYNFGDFSVDFNVVLRVKEYTDQYLIKHDFIKRLHSRYRQEGIEIPFPVRTVHLRQDADNAKPDGSKAG
ncbi:mechanosensitive ion channel family protein [Anaeroselena agilis]|uniref:Mechanosensitive ion channel family protein n=1 Tax=Anaeroselena agilis TaxID=3063788 RepID=A0ABU3P004_9FIRM|nr:mechanosensitive ion channel family protein [Selenomonadales bacterium 4137-cl]